MDNAGDAQHWDAVYANRGADNVSWFQSTPTVSLELIEILGVQSDAAVIDVGGGASVLVDHLVERGFSDLSVLDVSEVALRGARERLGARTSVSWIHQDLLTWRPERHFDLWHDRAVFHFLTSEADRYVYLATLRAALHPGGAAIVATFDEDGPDRCSGLPVCRYSSADLEGVLSNAGLTVVTARREEHTTPRGAIQPFTWVAARLSR